MVANERKERERIEKERQEQERLRQQQEQEKERKRQADEQKRLADEKKRQADEIPGVEKSPKFPFFSKKNIECFGKVLGTAVKCVVSSLLQTPVVVPRKLFHHSATPQSDIAEQCQG